ncbi:hypothetical protein EYF80_038603 [Liparis tanakae]|uniref:Uncharacterized protein n=1 Tax=Liparis tanakae TaxID=230148 RepID=A0A4Z2GDH7_9TELE|nr:hypothetical protein EYF80_038603 [Liparis tanakae]
MCSINIDKWPIKPALCTCSDTFCRPVFGWDAASWLSQADLILERKKLALGPALCCASSLRLGCSLCLGSSSASLTFLASWRGDDLTSLPFSPTRALEGVRRCLGEAAL